MMVFGISTSVRSSFDLNEALRAIAIAAGGAAVLLVIVGDDDVDDAWLVRYELLVEPNR